MFSLLYIIAPLDSRSKRSNYSLEMYIYKFRRYKPTRNHTYKKLLMVKFFEVNPGQEEHCSPAWANSTQNPEQQVAPIWEQSILEQATLVQFFALER